MPIEIAGQPTIVDGPRFAGLTIHVPLTESPSQGWLDELATKPLPGKGHRVVDAGIEFHLDRDAQDIPATMDRIARAIESTSAAADTADAAGTDHRTAARDRADRQLSEWWERRSQKSISAGEEAATG